MDVVCRQTNMAFWLITHAPCHFNSWYLAGTARGEANTQGVLLHVSVAGLKPQRVYHRRSGQEDVEVHSLQLRLAKGFEFSKQQSRHAPGMAECWGRLQRASVRQGPHAQGGHCASVICWLVNCLAPTHRGNRPPGSLPLRLLG